jgi:F-type H+-transporting ATPase subunit alpha
MKQTAGMLRLELAQYRELAAFAMFASDLDAATQKQLSRGARLVEILKQSQYQPLPVEKQVMIIFAATNGYLDDLPVDKGRKFEQEFYNFIDNQRPQVTKLVAQKKEMNEEVKAALHEALKDFKARFLESSKK